MANRAMSDEILECILPFIQDPRDRSAISMVCRGWYDLDRFTRCHITIALCYTTTPQRLYDRFPNIETLNLKGKPRAAMFNLIPEDWGGYATPWVDRVGAFPRLSSLHFRRMIVTDNDLKTIAGVKGLGLVSLKLDKCSGFSTDGLLYVTQSCKNLKTLFLEDSIIEEKSGEWFHQLALNNKVLEVFNFYMTFLDQIEVEDLELLARNCPLVSVKIGDTDLALLVNFFRSTIKLREFCGASVSEDNQYTHIVFPAQLTSVGLMYLGNLQAPLLFPIANRLKKLDLIYAPALDSNGHGELIRRCPNLEVLETTNLIGDQGLEVVSSTCKRLRRLRIERGADDQGQGVEPGVVTQRGLIAIAQGCQDLEYFAVYVTDITNEALERIGQNLEKLNDFRLVLLDQEDTITDLPLDNGVQALLQGCQRLQRFALYVRQGGLTDVGLSYIGQYSRNIMWMLLGYVGETDAGLLEFSKGCPSLQKLEIRACCFTERALAIAVTQLKSLKYMWVQGYRASQPGLGHLHEMARPYWNVELIPGDQYDDNGDNGQPARVDHPSHIVAYCSLAGPRVDHPDTVFNL